MAPPALCMCTNEKCGHVNGEPCGQPVQNPVTVQQVHGSVQDGAVSPWFEIGLCEPCWNNRPPWKKMTDKILARLR